MKYQFFVQNKTNRNHKKGIKQKRKSSKPRHIHNNTKGEEILARGQKRKSCPRTQAKVTFPLQQSCDLNVKIIQTSHAHI